MRFRHPTRAVVLEQIGGCVVFLVILILASVGAFVLLTRPWHTGLVAWILGL